MDLFVEPPWHFPVYVGFFKYEINRIPNDKVWITGQLLDKDEVEKEKKNEEEQVDEDEEPGFFDGLV